MLVVCEVGCWLLRSGEERYNQRREALDNGRSGGGGGSGEYTEARSERKANVFIMQFYAALLSRCQFGHKPT